MIMQIIDINFLYFNKYIKKPNSIFVSRIFYDLHAYIQRLFHAHYDCIFTRIPHFIISILNIRDINVTAFHMIKNLTKNFLVFLIL